MGDVHSYARPHEVAVSHIDLDLTADFDQQQLIGRATLTLDRRGDADTLHLDTRQLTIRAVSLDDDIETTFALGEEDPWLGQELTIDLQPETKRVHVHYETHPEAAAVQWLTPAQTTDGKHPFLFTQSQAILARSWVPCQDSPGVRFTYSATVRVPPELMAVMSASNVESKTDDGVYSFEMPQPIPSYLLALAIGDLEFRALDERNGVYAEPSVVEAAAWEFADTPDMMNEVEKLYGPYRWDRYDILVLPASFPFGGMENPRLTVVTPTILAGDRSLVALIAHELAHSWSGNLVTNATWNDFWLNEGFTVYLERRIMETIQGPDYVAMLASLGRQDLEGTIESIGPQHADTHLFLDLKGRDPDDGMTDIAYEKGHDLLRAMEETVGRETFDAFLLQWFEDNAFQSQTTDGFIDYVKTHLVKGDAELAEKLQLDAWIFGPGLPSNAVEVNAAAFAGVDAQIAAFNDGTPAKDLDTEGWTSHEWLHFLRGLPEAMEADRMADLDGAFGLTASGNSEVLHAWMHHVIANRYEAGYDALEAFLTGMGRRKFLQPLYQRMSENDDTLAMAKEIYAKARPRYHSVSSNTIDGILDWQG